MKNRHVVADRKSFFLMLVNNWHEWEREEWHLISFYWKHRTKSNLYCIGLLGYKLILSIKRNNL